MPTKRLQYPHKKVRRVPFLPPKKIPVATPLTDSNEILPIASLFKFAATPQPTLVADNVPSTAQRVQTPKLSSRAFPQGGWTILHKSDVQHLLHTYGPQFTVSLLPRGACVIRAGIFRDGFSYQHLTEIAVSAKNNSVQELQVDLGKYQTGTFELMILSLSPSCSLSPLLEPCEEVPLHQPYIQNFISPSLKLTPEIPLYYRLSGTAWNSFADCSVILPKRGDGVATTTWFNAFSSEKWNKHTNVQSVFASFDFSGEALLEWFSLTEKSEVPLHTLLLRSRERTLFSTPTVAVPKKGILGFRIYALAPSRLYGGGFHSASPALRQVNLGIAITTYKREEEVKATAVRLHRVIAAHPQYSNAIDVVIVDNGQTLAPQDLSGATLVPNRNLGGSGGFMRGMILHQDQGRASHVLFMDDDAACEPESIFRTMAFLQHATDEATAIGGAMFSSHIRFIQWENGAYFNFRCFPMHCHFNMHQVEKLLENENEDNEKQALGDNRPYGAWWFFAFPLRQVQKYSFPCFVRGDDIFFSYQNDFKLVHLSGVNVWQDDFKTKESPMTLYLDTRTHIVNALLTEHLAVKGVVPLLKMLHRFFHRFNGAYFYDTAHAIVSATKDVLQGPQYFQANMDMQAKRAELATRYTLEKPKPVPDTLPPMTPAIKDPAPTLLWKILRAFSFHGHILPNFCMSCERLWSMPKTEAPNKAFAWRRKKFYIYSDISQTYMLLKMNRKRYFFNLLLYYWTSFTFLLHYQKLRKQYQQFDTENLRTDAFWRKECRSGEENLLSNA